MFKDYPESRLKNTIIQLPYENQEFSTGSPAAFGTILGDSSRRREFCHFDNTLFSSILKHLIKVEGGASNDSLADA